jgi:hypothetical protein
MSKKKRTTTLTIVQDFPKKKADAIQANNVDLVQGKNTQGDIRIDDSRNKLTTLNIVQEFPKKDAKQNDRPITQDLVQAAISK